MSGPGNSLQDQMEHQADGDSGPIFQETITKPAEQFKVVQFIGGGISGIVCKVYHETDRQYYAVKRIRAPDDGGDESQQAANMEAIRQEVLTLVLFRNLPSTVNYYDAWYNWHTNDFITNFNKNLKIQNADPEPKPGQPDKHLYLYIRMELCEQTLGNWAIENAKDENRYAKAFDMISQLCNGVAALHANVYCHNDLHIGNVFVNNGQLKIGDFGSVVGPGSKFRQWFPSSSALASSSATVDVDGSPGSCLAKPFSHSPQQFIHCDISNIGVISCILLVGSDELRKHKSIRDGLIHAPPAIKQWAERLLEDEPGSRPKIGEVVRDFSEIVKDYNEYRESGSRDAEAAFGPPTGFWDEMNEGSPSSPIPEL